MSTRLGAKPSLARPITANPSLHPRDPLVKRGETSSLRKVNEDFDATPAPSPYESCATGRATTSQPPRPASASVVSGFTQNQPLPRPESASSTAAGLDYLPATTALLHKLKARSIMGSDSSELDEENSEPALPGPQIPNTPHPMPALKSPAGTTSALPPRRQQIVGSLYCAPTVNPHATPGLRLAQGIAFAKDVHRTYKEMIWNPTNRERADEVLALEWSEMARRKGERKDREESKAFWIKLREDIERHNVFTKGKSPPKDLTSRQQQESRELSITHPPVAGGGTGNSNSGSGGGSSNSSTNAGPGAGSTSTTARPPHGDVHASGTQQSEPIESDVTATSVASGALSSLEQLARSSLRVAFGGDDDLIASFIAKKTEYENRYREIMQDIQRRAADIAAIAAAGKPQNDPLSPPHESEPLGHDLSGLAASRKTIDELHCQLAALGRDMAIALSEIEESVEARLRTQREIDQASSRTNDLEYGILETSMKQAQKKLDHLAGDDKGGQDEPPMQAAELLQLLSEWTYRRAQLAHELEMDRSRIQRLLKQTEERERQLERQRKALEERRRQALKRKQQQLLEQGEQPQEADGSDGLSETSAPQKDFLDFWDEIMIGSELPENIRQRMRNRLEELRRALQAADADEIARLNSMLREKDQEFEAMLRKKNEVLRERQRQIEQLQQQLQAQAEAHRIAQKEAKARGAREATRDNGSSTELLTLRGIRAELEQKLKNAVSGLREIDSALLLREREIEQVESGTPCTNEQLAAANGRRALRALFRSIANILDPGTRRRSSIVGAQAADGTNSTFDRDALNQLLAWIEQTVVLVNSSGGRDTAGMRSVSEVTAPKRPQTAGPQRGIQLKVPTTAGVGSSTSTRENQLALLRKSDFDWAVIGRLWATREATRFVAGQHAQWSQLRSLAASFNLIDTNKLGYVGVKTLQQFAEGVGLPLSDIEAAAMLQFLRARGGPEEFGWTHAMLQSQYPLLLQDADGKIPKSANASTENNLAKLIEPFALDSSSLLESDQSALLPFSRFAAAALTLHPRHAADAKARCIPIISTLFALFFPNVATTDRAARAGSPGESNADEGSLEDETEEPSDKEEEGDGDLDDTEVADTTTMTAKRSKITFDSRKLRREIQRKGSRHPALRPAKAHVLQRRLKLALRPLYQYFLPGFPQKDVEALAEMLVKRLQRETMLKGQDPSGNLQFTYSFFESLFPPKVAMRLVAEGFDTSAVLTRADKAVIHEYQQRLRALNAEVSAKPSGDSTVGSLNQHPDIVVFRETFPSLLLEPTESFADRLLPAFSRNLAAALSSPDQGFDAETMIRFGTAPLGTKQALVHLLWLPVLETAIAELTSPTTKHLLLPSDGSVQQDALVTAAQVHEVFDIADAPSLTGLPLPARAQLYRARKQASLLDAPARRLMLALCDDAAQRSLPFFEKVKELLAASGKEQTKQLEHALKDLGAESYTPWVPWTRILDDAVHPRASLIQLPPVTIGQNAQIPKSSTIWKSGAEVADASASGLPTSPDTALPVPFVASKFAGAGENPTQQVARAVQLLLNRVDSRSFAAPEGASAAVSSADDFLQGRAALACIVRHLEYKEAEAVSWRERFESERRRAEALEGQINLARSGKLASDYVQGRSESPDWRITQAATNPSQLQHSNQDSSHLQQHPVHPHQVFNQGLPPGLGYYIASGATTPASIPTNSTPNISQLGLMVQGTGARPFSATAAHARSMAAQSVPSARPTEPPADNAVVVPTAVKLQLQPRPSARTAQSGEVNRPASRARPQSAINASRAQIASLRKLLPTKEEHGRFTDNVPQQLAAIQTSGEAGGEGEGEGMESGRVTGEGRGQEHFVEPELTPTLRRMPTLAPQPTTENPGQAAQSSAVRVQVVRLEDSDADPDDDEDSTEVGAEVEGAEIGDDAKND